VQGLKLIVNETRRHAYTQAWYFSTLSSQF